MVCVCVCLRGGGTYSSMINGVRVCVFEGRGHVFVNGQWCVCVCVFEGRGHVFVNDQWCALHACALSTCHDVLLLPCYNDA